MLRFSISLLKTNQETILELLEFEEILNFLKGASLFQVYNSNHEHAVKDAMAEAEFISPSCFEKLQKEFELQFGNNQLNGMRLLVSQLRSDSQKMVKTLNDMSLRNNYLEKEYREKDVYRKGSELEILGLRREVEKLKRNLGELMIEKDALIKENESLRLQGDLGSLSV